MQLQMTAPMDIGLEQHDASLGFGQDDIFDLTGAERGMRANGGMARLTRDDEMPESEEEGEYESSGDEEEFLDSDEEREKKVAGLEAELDGMYDTYQERMREKDAKFKVTEQRKKSGLLEAWDGIRGKDEDDEDMDSEDGGWDKMEQAKEHADDDSSSDESDEEDEEVERPPKGGKRRREEPAAHPSKRVKILTKLEKPATAAESSRAAQVWFSQDVFSGMDDLNAIADDDEEGEEDDVSMDNDGTEDGWQDDVSFRSVSPVSVLIPLQESGEEDSDDFETVPQDQDEDVEMWNAEADNEDEIKKEKIKSGFVLLSNFCFLLTFVLLEYGLVTPEAVTIAQQLVNRQKTKTQLINDGFNRYSLNSQEGLPSWFLDDEAKNYKSNLPITKEAVNALRARQRALDARPIKKVAEAKARKKYKAAQRLEKAMKKAEGVNATSDMTEREKASQIEKLMRKGMSTAQKEKKEIKLVVAKGAHKGVKGRPKGVKGRYTMVDSRMKKEVRFKNIRPDTSN